MILLFARQSRTCLTPQMTQRVFAETTSAYVLKKIHRKSFISFSQAARDHDLLVCM